MSDEKQKPPVGTTPPATLPPVPWGSSSSRASHAQAQARTQGEGLAARGWRRGLKVIILVAKVSSSWGSCSQQTKTLPG